MQMECAESTTKKALLLKLMTGFSERWYDVVARIKDINLFQDSSMHGKLNAGAEPLVGSLHHHPGTTIQAHVLFPSAFFRWLENILATGMSLARSLGVGTATAGSVVA